MAAAIADGKVPLLPAPQPLASLRATAASLARACRRFALATAAAVMHLLLLKPVGDAVLCLCLASAWLLAAGTAAIHIGRSACGDDCAVVFAGARVGALSGFLFGVLCSPVKLVFAHRVRAAVPNANDEERALAAGIYEVLCDPMLAVAVFATGPFLLLMVVGGLLKWEEIVSVGSVGISVIWCFVIIPTAAVRVWRVTRPGWQCEIERTPEEKIAL